MPLNTPQSRLNVRQVAIPKRTVPLEQIIAVQGQNPLAQGIETAGNIIGQTLARRAQLRQQGEQIAQLSKIIGKEVPSGFENSGLSPDDFLAASKLTVDGKPKPLQGTITKDGKTYQPFYNEKTGEVSYQELLGPKNAPPKGLSYIGDTPDGDAISYDANTGLKSVPGGKPYSGTTLPKTLGATEQRTQSLVKTGQQAIGSIKRELTPQVLSELKAIRLVPGKVYSQLASPEAKRVYTNLRRAMENEVYLRTGATANPTELENSIVANMAALNDNPQDFLGRMDLLDKSIGNFSFRGLQPISSPGKQPFVEPDVAAYAKKHGISYEESLSIKQQRTGQQ